MATTEQAVGGVSFALTEEQMALRELAHDFAEREIRPKAAEYDEHSTHPANVIAKAHEVGLMNPHVPEEYGGLGLPGFEGMLIGEELSWGCSGIAVSIVANTLGAGPVILAGSDEQKASWLPPLLDEPILCSFGLSEPDAGSDVARIRTTAVRLGEEGDGFKIAMQTLDFTRPGTAAGAVGVAQAAYDHAVAYARERVTFDVPIAMHQGVSFLIADMATEIEAARLVTWQAAWMLDQGLGRDATLYSSFAKRFAADTAMRVTTDAVQIFGGYGYIKEYPVEKLMRDAKLFQIYEGTSQIQRLVIAREIFLPREP